MPQSLRRSSALFAVAVAGSNLSQVGWLIAGARALPGDRFGTVLTAQALYGVLQIIVDNGTSFLGARRSARGALTAEQRQEIVALRLALAMVCVVAGVAITGVGAGRTLEAFAPFAGALLLFAVLNVWEDYGAGRVLPYTAYLLLRSLTLAVVVSAFAIAGADAPLVIGGLCELGAVAIAMLAFRAVALPGRRWRIDRATLRSTRDIGAPALITQYDFAAPTVIFGVTGHPRAAAVAAVTLRLLSGLQGFNGAVGAAIFPQLARQAKPGPAESRTARRAAAVMVGLSLAGLLVVAVAAPILVSGFLNSSGAREEAAIVLGMGAAGAAALVMHRGFVFVAWEREHELVRAGLAGAVLVTAGAVAGLALGGPGAAVAAAAGFVLGQMVTLGLLLRVDVPASLRTRADLLLAGVAVLVLPALAVLLAAAGGTRVAVASMVAALALIAGGARARRARVILRRV